MAWIGYILVIQMFLLSFVLDVAYSITCDSKPPVKQLAYNAAYEFYFPDKRGATQSCSWLFTAYRDAHILRLRFDDVNMTQAGNGSCVNEVIVFDGPNAGSRILRSFCGVHDVDIQTSTKQALVVLSVKGHHPAQAAKFHLRYNSMTPRDDDHQVVWILAFVGVVGIFCCIAFCCGILKCLVQWRDARVSAQTRTSPSLGSGAVGSSANQDGDSDGDGGDASAKNISISDRVWNLLRNVFHEKHWWNSEPAPRRNPRTTVRNGPSNRPPRRNAPHHQQQQQQQQVQNRRNRQHQSSSSSPQQPQHQQQQQQNSDVNSHQRRRQNYLVHQPRSDAVASSLDFTDTSMAQTSREEFSFQDIPVSSFTSDPSEIKPPSYEECLKNTNPLYLFHQNGGENTIAYYNRDLDNKDDGDPIGIENSDSLAPPPPYKEIDTNNKTPTVTEDPRQPVDIQVLPRMNNNNNNNTIRSHDRHVVQERGITNYDNNIPSEPPPPFTELPDTFPVQSGPTGISSCQTANSPSGRVLNSLKDETRHDTKRAENDANCSNTNNYETVHNSMGDTTDRSEDEPNGFSTRLTRNASDQECRPIATMEETTSSSLQNTRLASWAVTSIGSVPYAMMRRSGLITSLSDQQDACAANGVTPVENCLSSQGDIPGGSLRLVEHLTTTLEDVDGESDAEEDDEEVGEEMEGKET